MFPQGFLGTRADLLMDIVIVSLLAIIATVIISWRLARGKQYARHKGVQIATVILLGAIVLLFEYNLRLQGGIVKATAASSYAGTMTLTAWIYIHSFFSITTAIIWPALLITSLLKFPKPPAPNAFSPRHRFWGRIGMTWMLLTGLTAIPLYVYGFAL
jgi:putative membrane protein